MYIKQVEFPQLNPESLTRVCIFPRIQDQAAVYIMMNRWQDRETILTKPSRLGQRVHQDTGAQVRGFLQEYVWLRERCTMKWPTSARMVTHRICLSIWLPMLQAVLLERTVPQQESTAFATLQRGFGKLLIFWGSKMHYLLSLMNLHPSSGWEHFSSE